MMTAYSLRLGWNPLRAAAALFQVQLIEPISAWSGHRVPLGAIRCRDLEEWIRKRLIMLCSSAIVRDVDGHSRVSSQSTGFESDVASNTDYKAVFRYARFLVRISPE
jgi:hypothetical protein